MSDEFVPPSSPPSPRVTVAQMFFTLDEVRLLEELLRREGDQGRAVGLEKVYKRLIVALDGFEMVPGLGSSS